MEQALEFLVQHSFRHQLQKQAIPSHVATYIPDVKRLCGSGAVGQSFEVCGELGNGGSPLGMGLGCRKLSEKSDCDSVTAPSKGDRAL